MARRRRRKNKVVVNSKPIDRKRLYIGIISVLAIVLLIVGVKTYQHNQQQNHPAMKIVRGLVSNQFFNEGTYDEYQDLFLNPAYVMSEKSYDESRENENLKQSIFKYDNGSVDSIMKHMVLEKVSDDDVKVYYLKDVNDKDEMKKAAYWEVVKSDYDGSWKLKN